VHRGAQPLDDGAARRSSWSEVMRGCLRSS